MDQVQRRIAALARSRAKLLFDLRELDRLREQVGKAGPGAEPCKLQQPSSIDPRSCDPGPVGFEFAEEVAARLGGNSDITLWPTRPTAKSMLRAVKPIGQG